MKRAICVILVAALMLPLAACGAGKPEDTVTKYFTAAQKFNSEEMDTYILPSNNKETTETSNSNGQIDDFTQCIVDYSKGNAAKMTYKITNCSVNGENAAITVNCRYVDGSAIYKASMEKFFSESYSSLFSFRNDSSTSELTNKLAEIMKEQIRNTPETFKEVTLTLNCIKKDNVWYITKENDEMEDILLSGFQSAMKDVDSLDGSKQAGFPDIFSGVASDILGYLFEVIQEGLHFLS